jgi:hypothetical protein
MLLAIFHSLGFIDFQSRSTRLAGYTSNFTTCHLHGLDDLGSHLGSPTSHIF